MIAIGNALNLGGDPTVTRGIVSAKDRDLTAEGVSLEGLIQTDAAINPGNSGGPLVNAAGQVVGMNTAIVADAQNLGFSIAIDRARPIIEDLEAGEGQVTPDQAFLGVSSTDVSELTDEVQGPASTSSVDEGAFVTEVVPARPPTTPGCSPATSSSRSTATRSPRRPASGTPSSTRSRATRVELKIVRDGDEQTVEAELGQRGDRS